MNEKEANYLNFNLMNQTTLKAYEFMRKLLLRLE